MRYEMLRTFYTKSVDALFMARNMMLIFPLIEVYGTTFVEVLCGCISLFCRSIFLSSYWDFW